MYDVNLLLKPGLAKTLAKTLAEHGHSNIALNQMVRHPWAVNGVGIIPINGVLLNADSFYASMLGGRSYQDIRQSLHIFEKDESIASIVLDFNSPGGEVAGCAELAEYIAGIQKPTVAYAAGDALSAAYWLAAACNKIIAHKTSFVGCVGTYQIFKKPSGDIEIIVSTQSPDKVPDGSTEEGRAQIRASLDIITGHFIGDVAKYRDIPASAVLDNFGRGDVVGADGALAVGMIDAIGDFNSALQIKLDDVALADRLDDEKGGRVSTDDKTFRSPENKKRYNMAKRKAELVIVDNEGLPPELVAIEVTAETIKTNFPEIAQELIDEGAAGVDEEMVEVEETAEMADMAVPEEAAVVAQARARKMSNADLQKALLKIKSGAKPKAQALLDKELELRGEDQPAVQAVGGGATVVTKKRNGIKTRLAVLRNKGKR